jgi:hypothetical protein
LTTARSSTSSAATWRWSIRATSSRPSAPFGASRPTYRSADRATRPGETIAAIGEIIREAYQREEQVSRGEGAKRPAMYDLHILLGYCEGHDSGIARFSKNANFHPIYLLGIEATGPTAAVEYFE